MVEIKRAIKEKYINIWKEDWEQYKAGRQTKQFFPEPDEGKAKELYKNTRIGLGTLVRVISRHNTLNYHMSKMCPGHDHRCRYCKEERETFVHFLTNCPATMGERINIFQDRFKEVEDIREIRPKEILDFAREPKIAEALEQYEEALLSNV